ncbi:MAG: hypothetical protein O2U61_02900 [Candidatus Bathyarchaeota archaeon]|nr:hypothetical protein [Candidatus Bathyarchaeota archaeon]
MFYKVLKQTKQAPGSQIQTEPELFIVQDVELEHFLHEQENNNSILVFDSISERNLYLLSNDAD